ncbi:MAG: OadG family protein, partial [Clostridia bacterium]|nr:OadG family protein [Clostridia bacterium]
LIGQIVVFLGIAFLVFIVWAVGKLLNKMPKKKEKEEEVALAPTTPISQPSDDLDEQTIAVITAAIAAYYQQQQIPCEFIIKKIKRNSKI